VVGVQREAHAHTDLVDLLARRRGGYVTVVLAAPAAVENPGPHAVAAWRDQREQLQHAGAPEAALAAVDPVVPDAHHHGEWLGVVAADDGELLLVEHHPEPPRRPRARWAPLPSLVPVIEQRQSRPAHLIVLADHTGADITAVASGLAAASERGGDQPGYPIARNAPGGWSQRRYQQRAENLWDRNAADAARTVVALADRFAPAVILVGGDPRAKALLLGDLPARLQQLVEEIPGSRHPDGSEQETRREVHRQVATAAARDTVAVLEEWRQETGRGGRGTDGPEATLAALRAGQVATLLVHDDPDDDRLGWIGPEPTDVGCGEDRPEGAVPARLVDVATTAALATSAAVRVVPAAGGPSGALGSLLRWG